MKPEISIIIPVYNAEHYLKPLLDSVLKQTFTNFEVIIMNDGSTDDSQAIIDQYSFRDSRIKAYQQNNLGQSAARNNALKYVKGQYLAFLDADDIIAEDYLNRLYDATEGWKDVALCSYQKFNSKTGEILLKRKTADWNVLFEEEYSHVFQYSPCARLMRTGFIRDYNLEFGVGEQLEDGPYCMAAGILANDVGIVNDIMYYYRVHESSTMGNVREGRKTPRIPYRSLETSINLVLSNTEDEKKKQILEYCSVKIMAGWLTNMYKNCSLAIHKDICTYCYRIIDTYFQTIVTNPYISISTGKNKLPFSHRVAVVMFLYAYRLRALYVYSAAIVLLLRLFKLDD